MQRRRTLATLAFAACLLLLSPAIRAQRDDEPFVRDAPGLCESNPCLNKIPAACGGACIADGSTVLTVSTAAQRITFLRSMVCCCLELAPSMPIRDQQRVCSIPRFHASRPRASGGHGRRRRPNRLHHSARVFLWQVNDKPHVCRWNTARAHAWRPSAVP